MKVVHISSSDSGGAGIAARRLNDALCSQGVDSKLLCLHKSFKSKNVIQYQVPLISKLLLHSHLPIGQNLFLNSLSNFEKKYETVSFPKALFDISKCKEVEEADIINLHWVGNMLNYHNFFKNVKKPIVWTLHDMNPFLGIAHYQGDLKRNDELHDIESRIARYKEDSINQHPNIHIVNLCNWMKEYSQSSEVFSAREHHIIPNSIDQNIYKPYNRDYCRDILGLPKDKQILMFCAQGVLNQRKGFDILINALSYIDRDCFLAIVGDSSKIKLPFDLDHKLLGTIGDDLHMAMLYSAADAFILPSREDNLPNTMVESLSCGTPVISFSNGGMKDIITSDDYGTLVTEQTPQALGIGINHTLKDLTRFKRGLISNYAIKLFNPQNQAESYMQLYQQILNRL